MKRSLEVRPTPDWHTPLIILGGIILMNATAFGAILIYGALS